MTRHAVESTSAMVGEDDAVVAAVNAGDEAAFASLVECHTRELQAHCRRLLRSAVEAEDAVQETFLRAWRSRTGFEGRATFRAWLYRIATNACLDILRRQADRLPGPPGPAGSAGPSGSADGAGPGEPAARARHRVVRPAAEPRPAPFPDQLPEEAAPREAEPDAAAVARETIELALLVTIQHLPPRQRAVLIVRDVLGWPAADTAELLGTSVAAANSALQRARATLQARRPAHARDRASAGAATGRERALLRRVVDAHDRTDAAALAGACAGT